MKYNARIERQIKVINPNATDEEIRAAVRDGSAKNIFMESGFISEKTIRSKRILQQLEDRNEDIKKIEKTILVTSIKYYV
ncbi:Syntaxin-like protein psy1 [Smittium culicis]|uniref:Syntaxin-like protein psy1 n=1 Tax=Smittium culicis TaxID=133412 RepID=A0A1R1Y3A7_9FUNG|nr:Syntaxin-like protein psy1 [Smittium culicis]